MTKVLKEMGAKPILKSRWVYQCAEGTTAMDVTKKVLAKVDTNAMVEH